MLTNSAHVFKHLDCKVKERLAANLKVAGFVVLG